MCRVNEIRQMRYARGGKSPRVRTCPKAGWPYAKNRVIAAVSDTHEQPVKEPGPRAVAFPFHNM